MPGSELRAFSLEDLESRIPYLSLQRCCTYLVFGCLFHLLGYQVTLGREWVYRICGLRLKVSRSDCPPRFLALVGLGVSDSACRACRVLEVIEY